MNQSQFIAITCNSLEAREKSRVLYAIGFDFTCHWLKNWRESFKPITKRGNRNHNHIIAFDSHFKTASSLEKISTDKRLAHSEWLLPLSIRLIPNFRQFQRWTEILINWRYLKRRDSVCNFAIKHWTNESGIGLAQALILRSYTPYSKMAANKSFFCLHVYSPSLPLFHFKILLCFLHADEASRAN